MTKPAISFELFEDEQDAVNSCFPRRAVKRLDILSFVQQEEAMKAATEDTTSLTVAADLRF